MLFLCFFFRYPVLERTKIIFLIKSLLFVFEKNGIPVFYEILLLKFGFFVKS